MGGMGRSAVSAEFIALNCARGDAAGNCERTTRRFGELPSLLDSSLYWLDHGKGE
jgi:hypothetical protein